MKKLKSHLVLKLKIPKITHSQTKNVKIIDNRKTIHRILNGLYISGSIIANDETYLTENKFTHVINCSSSATPVPKDLKINSMNLCLRDDPSSDIISPLFKTIKFLESDNSSSKKILFHCIEGISRGPALMAGYLMWKYNLSKDEATSVIVAKRPCVDINFGFLVQLDKWEIFLRGSEKEDEINLFKIGDNITSIDEKEIQFCDNLKDTIVVRLNKFFIFVGGMSTNKKIVCALESKNKEFVNYLTNFYINYHRGENVINKIKSLSVNFKEFSKEKRAGGYYQRREIRNKCGCHSPL